MRNPYWDTCGPGDSRMFGDWALADPMTPSILVDSSAAAIAPRGLR